MFLLLVLPLAGQLLTLGMVVHTSTRLDAVAKQELAAKKVIALGQEIVFLHGQLVTQVATPKFFSSDGAAVNEEMVELLMKKTNELAERTRNNEHAWTLANRLHRESRRFVSNLRELAASYEPVEHRLYSAEFLTGFEFMETLKVVIDHMEKDSIELLKIYTRTAKEFEPAEMAARRDMRNSFIIAGAFNVLLVIALAVVIQKRTLSRLQTLMENMKHFADGTREYRRLDGKDELAELDEAFQKMSSRRNRLEELRKSMRAMVAHDLRTPLTSMGLNLELVLAGDVGAIPPTVTRVVKRVHSEASRLQRLSNTLLDIDKLEDGKLDINTTPAACTELIETSIEAVRAQFERKKLVIEFAATGEFFCLCERDRTIQVLVNLLSNAVKFADANSKIEVTCQLQSDTKNVRFEVLDEGPGVPAEKAMTLFTKFTQLDQPEEIKQQGSGLGLYICKMLVEAQRGDVGYNKRTERGSCFWFSLPVADATVSESINPN